MAGLGGRVIACLEARYAAEMADLVVRHGGITYPAPCLREVHEPDTDETRQCVDLMIGDDVDSVIFLTGVGVETILDGARHLNKEDELLSGLAAKRVAVRGPKTLNALRRLGVRVDVVAPEPYTSGALLEQIKRSWDMRDQTVVVQRYGGPAPVLTDGLRDCGARVTEVSPYRWERPADEEPVARLIEDLDAGWIDVLAATSAAQVDHLFDIATERGQEQRLRTALSRPKLRIAAQGIVCASAFERRGIRVDVVPGRASMGSLILEIARGVQDGTGSPPMRQADDELVAIFAGNCVAQSHIERMIGELGAGVTVGVLQGRSHAGDRLVEAAAVRRGLSVQRFAPSRNALHPADKIIRRATRVMIISDGARSPSVGRLLRLAERYAKPVAVVDLTAPLPAA